MLFTILATLLLIGCHPTKPSDQSASRTDESTRAPNLPADFTHGETFGIPNSYSGELTDELATRVPDELRNAGWIEVLRPITATELAKVIEFNEQVAEEVRGGNRFVAVKSLMSVVVPGVGSGLTTVIRRYVVSPE